MATAPAGTSGGYVADPAGLSSASSTFTGEADALDSAVASLIGRLQTDGSCWGTDDQGASFGAAYQPRANQMLVDLDDLVAGLRAAATALAGSAQQYQAAEQASTMSSGSWSPGS